MSARSNELDIIQHMNTWITMMISLNNTTQFYNYVRHSDGLMGYTIKYQFRHDTEYFWAYRHSIKLSIVLSMILILIN